MNLLSVNVGLPREVEWRGRPVRTSIFKAPVAGRVRVRKLNLDGDRQSDLSVHGGRDKAVYVYPSEHYPYWKSRLPDRELPWGAFGENLTTAGLLEDRIGIGDRIRCGSAEFVVTQPRMPCHKLEVRLDLPGMIESFMRSGRTGFYLAVLRVGAIAAGDPVEIVASHPARVSVADVVGLMTGGGDDRELLRRASEIPELPEGWRARFRARL